MRDIHEEYRFYSQCSVHQDTAFRIRPTCPVKERVVEWFLPIADNKASLRPFIRIFESEIFD